jgi:hypothetical protein
LPAERFSQFTLITKSRSDATLNEVAGVQLPPPSSQNEMVASVVGGGGFPPFPEVIPVWQAENPAAKNKAAQPREAVRHPRLTGLFVPIRINPSLIRAQNGNAKPYARWSLVDM